MKLLVSRILYTLGDWISRTTMFWGKGYGYPLYSKLMRWSVRLDEKGVIWKYVEKTGKCTKKCKCQYTSKNSRNRRNSV